jgi:hypothetical protein
MPVANLAQRQENLARLCGAHSHHCECDAARASDAKAMAKKLPLSHAAGEDTLVKILQSGALLSQTAVGLPPHKAEADLDTADDVFFYLGAFAYPDTECGLLFLPALEADHQSDGVSTPFDSGALVNKVSPPSAYTGNRVGFVRDHEMPVSAYRDLLGRVIADYARACGVYLRAPEEFKCECGFVREHPFGITGGDWRAATFEVRIPKQVPLSHPHLHAVFVRNGFEPRELAPLRRAGVRIERFEPDPGADSFGALREACISFIQEKLLK